MVPEAVAPAVGVRFRLDPAAHHHVHLAAQEELHQGRGAGRIVGGVAIHHQVHIGVDVREHAAHHMTLALGGLEAHQRAGGPGHLHRAVRGVVVVDEDGRPGQGPAEVPHHAGDGGLLVETGDEDGHAGRGWGRAVHGAWYPGRSQRMWPWASSAARAWLRATRRSRMAASGRSTGHP